MVTTTEIFYIVTGEIDHILNEDEPSGFFDTSKKFWPTDSKSDIDLLARVYRGNIKVFTLKAYNTGINIRTGDIISLESVIRDNVIGNGWVKNISHKSDVNWTHGSSKELEKFINLTVRYGWLRQLSPEEKTAVDYGLI